MSDTQPKPPPQAPEADGREHYYTADNALVSVPCLHWLEDGRYYDTEEGAWLDCSRYYTGTEDDEDGSSVWLNDYMVEVEV